MKSAAFLLALAFPVFQHAHSSVDPAGPNKELFNALQLVKPTEQLPQDVSSQLQDCGKKLSEARNKTSNTVSQRATLAQEALDCARAVSAYALAVARPDTAYQIQRLLEVGLSKYEATVADARSEVSFLGLTWGVGLGYSFGRDKSVDDAELVGGVVRVKSELKQQPRALLEFHKYFWCNSDGKDGTRGCGPFVAVAATSDKVLSGVGLGLMYGRKSKESDSEGYSIGVGVLLDAKVKDLADGFKPNEAPPSGETKVRFSTKSRWSTLLFVSRTF